MKEKKQKKEKFIYSPMKMTESLKEMGESYTRKSMVLYYCVLLIGAVILGLLFELKAVYLVIVGIVYVAFVPQLLYNQKKQAYELRRFNDVNAYMSQMAQSFTSTGNILNSLMETADTFSSGKMHGTLMEAIAILDKEVDVDIAVRESLQMLEKRYGCEKLRNLHEFLQMAQERGGDCSTEFSIIEKARMAWETAISRYRRDTLSVRNVCSILYGMMLILCIFIMNAFPNQLSIIHMEFIQVVNTILLSLFIAFFVMLDTRVNGSLLKDSKYMSKEMADNYFATMQGAVTKKEKHKYLAYPIITAVVVVIIFLMNPSPVAAAIGMILVLIMANMEKIILAVTVSTLKNEIMKAFPKWLFDIMLLIQRESVDSAILNSSKTAPPVLQAELNRICNMIRRKPGNPDAYMSFLADFNILQIETSMRKLYSLSVGTGGSSDVMKFIIDSNMELLTEAERKSIEMKSDTSTLYQFFPILVTSAGMLMYCLAILIVSLGQVLQFLQ